jgi:hypothetical protein
MAMFKETVSMLRRMVAGHPREDADGVAVAEERRVRVRYPSGAQTSLVLVNGTEHPRLSGRVRNISRGGINLLVPEGFEPGSMLGIDLPSPDGHSSYTVLACVVHATARPGGEWAVGCTFAQELTDAELRAFGGQRQKPSAPDDQRTWVRFPCRVRAACQVVADPPEAPWPAEVLDLSPSGIGLRVERPVEPGTLLNVDLHDAAGRLTTSMLACVVHVTDPDGEGGRALGCNFIRELSEQEIQALL